MKIAAPTNPKTENAYPIHAPGIYFGLSDTDYHADPALGSTGIKRLLASAPDYWWQSPLNPAREPETDTPSKMFGRALHRCVLEGRDRFVTEYAPTDHSGNIKAGKEERERIESARMKALKRDDYNRILAAAAFIKANPHLARAFENGKSEVSIFWEEDGIRFKARHDYLKLNAIVDLKSIRNTRQKEFQRACRDAIAEYGYTISAEQYCEGRRRMAGLLADGAVFGDHDPEWLRAVADNEAFAFVLVFWQAEGSPISHGFQISPGNPLLESARYEIDLAVDAYKRFMERFGTDTAWMLAEPLQELDATDLPIWFQQQRFVGA
ncbi:MAG: hypothetical protein GC201_18920 [Alphaproteobacteria bacterium]|nr:hypothetical protein [Alphaproteobacteria bacterium]